MCGNFAAIVHWAGEIESGAEHKFNIITFAHTKKQAFARRDDSRLRTTGGLAIIDMNVLRSIALRPSFSGGLLKYV